MLEIIASWIGNAWNELKPCQIIPAYDTGVHLRFGKFVRILEPGLRWKLPLTDSFLTTIAVVNTMGVSCQSLQTKDRKQIVVEAIVRYSIADAEKYMLGCTDQDSVLNDTILGVVGKFAEQHTWAEFRSSDRAMVNKVRAELRPFGIKIERLTFATRAMIRSYRIIIDNPPTLESE